MTDVGLSFAVPFAIIYLSIIYFLSIVWFRKELTQRFLIVSFLSLLFHVAGSLYNYAYVVSGHPTDSTAYFYQASNQFGLGTHFIYFMSYYCRLLFFGDSFLSSYFFSAGISYLASLLLYFAYVRWSDRVGINPVVTRQKWLPILVLLFWPSFIFYTTTFGKDSIVNLCLAFILFQWALPKKSIMVFFGLIVGAAIVFMIRPYLFLLLFVSVMISLLFFSKISLLSKISASVLVAVFLAFLIPFLFHFGGASFSGAGDISMASIASDASANLNRQQTGTSIHLIVTPSNIFYLLPITTLANAFLPLGIYVNGFNTLWSSIENLFLLYILCFYWKQRRFWIKTPFFVFITLWFIGGMLWLGLLNTNLGLAMREKIMYDQGLLVLFFVLWNFRKYGIKRNVSNCWDCL